jgi:hypothetical protein
MIKKEKRKTQLLVDNATSHLITKVMSKVTVKFLQPNLTSEVRPLDHGIIRAVNARYHKNVAYLVAIAKHSSTTPD